MKKIERNYELAEKLSGMRDDMLIGPEELAAYLGISDASIRTGVVTLPPRVEFTRKLQWRLGDVRVFVQRLAQIAPPPPAPAAVKGVGLRGRPTKALERRRRVAAVARG